MSEEAYKVWTLIFNGLTSLGTVGAVIVALFLYRKQDEPKISVDANTKAYTGALGPEVVEGVAVMATNEGIRQEGVKIYGYTIGLLRIVGIQRRQTSCIIKVTGGDSIPGTKGFPSSIEPGEIASHFLMYQEFVEKQLEFFTEYLDKLKLPACIKNKEWFLRTIMLTARCWVSTSRGRAVSSRLGRSLREYIIEQYQGMKESEEIKDSEEVEKSDQSHTEEDGLKS